jgi:hypothetical protein
MVLLFTWGFSDDHDVLTTFAIRADLRIVDIRVAEPALLAGGLLR